MAVKVAKVVIVVDINQRDDGLDYRRDAVTSDGQRVDDARWRAGAYYGRFSTPGVTAEGWAAERRADLERGIPERYPRTWKVGMLSLVRALRKVGVRTTAAELRTLPLNVQFTDAAEAQIVREESVSP